MIRSLFAQVSADESGINDLRTATLNVIAYGPFVLVTTVLAYVAIHPLEIESTIWLVIFPLLATGLGQIRHWGRTINGLILLLGFGISTVAATLVDPSRPYVFALPLLMILASMIFGGLATFATAGLTSVVVLIMASQVPGVIRADSVYLVLSLIWATAILAWLSERPTRTALDWAWRNYLVAVERSEQLRDRQAELGRLAKSLTEACERLEQLNGELERARRAAEDARQLKSEFAAAISHELRTPLNLIIGFAEMMMSTPAAYSGVDLPPPYRKDLETIHRNASHISQLIDDVLDLSQIEAHRMPLERRYVSLPQIVDDAVSTVAPFFERLALSITNEVPSDVPSLFVDPNRIRQVLINLLNNAARFTDRGGVTLRATWDDHEVIVSVADTGVGIATEDLPHVFQEFRQVGPTERRRGGSGLGLAVCKHFAELHGGSMWVESSLGQGSTFYLALPRCENVVTAPLSLVHPQTVARERTIVIFGGEYETNKLFQRYLDGYRVEQAASIGELHKLMKDRPVHALMVTDPQDAKAWSIAWADDPRIRDLPVVTCSLRTPRILASELGVDEYLTKPVSGEKLRAVLRRVARGARDVVVAEDDPDMARLLAGVVQMVFRRCRVRQAFSGTEALSLIREQCPDLLLLDLLMEKGDGYCVVRTMREDPSLCNVPIVVVTAKGTKEETLRTSSLQIGRSDGLTIGELMRCLRGSLDALLTVDLRDSAPAPTTGLAGEPASRESLLRQGNARGISLGESSTR